MAVALAALDARRAACIGRTARATIPLADFYRLPGDTPERDTVLGRGELITAVELPPPPAAAPLDATARCATARRSPSPWSRSPPRSTSPDGTVRDVRLAFGGVAHKPWRARAAEDALRGAPADAGAFAGAAEAELAAGAAAAATTRSRSPWPQAIARPHARRSWPE